MSGSVVKTCIYVVKGAREESTDLLRINPETGVLFDRRFAIRRTPGDGTQWEKKGAFYVGMNTPQMAREVPRFNGRDLDPAYLEELGLRLGAKEALQAQDTKGTYALCVALGASVSFLNLATVRALSDFMGVEIDPRRFRMNVWLDGLAPFEELEWVNGFPGTREIAVGNCRFRVDDACERCAAIEASPDTGTFDLRILKPLGEMMRQRGYVSPHRGTPVVMGILAVPLSAGAIELKDEIRLI